MYSEMRDDVANAYDKIGHDPEEEEKKKKKKKKRKKIKTAGEKSASNIGGASVGGGT